MEKTLEREQTVVLPWPLIFPSEIIRFSIFLIAEVRTRHGGVKGVAYNLKLMFAGVFPTGWILGYTVVHITMYL